MVGDGGRWWEMVGDGGRSHLDDDKEHRACDHGRKLAEEVVALALLEIVQREGGEEHVGLRLAAGAQLGEEGSCEGLDTWLLLLEVLPRLLHTQAWGRMMVGEGRTRLRCGRYGEMWEIWVWADAGRYGEMRGDMGRSRTWPGRRGPRPKSSDLVMALNAAAKL